MTATMKQAYELARACKTTPFIGQVDNVKCYIIREYMNFKNNERVTWYLNDKRVSKARAEGATK